MAGRDVGVGRAGKRGYRMKRMVSSSLVLAIVLTSSAATAQERAGDAALGAVSGAVVLGPVGAVAGAFVGYMAGPSIANAWGLRHSSYPRRVRRAAAAEPSPNASENLPAPRSQADMPAPVSPPPKSASAAPPVQPLY
jgi:hypothetical protein